MASTRKTTTRKAATSTPRKRAPRPAAKMETQDFEHYKNVLAVMHTKRIELASLSTYFDKLSTELIEKYDLEKAFWVDIRTGSIYNGRQDA